MTRGRREPIPWWVNVFYAADRCHCPPWEMVEGETPREFWMLAGQVLTGAENDAREQVERRTSRGKGRH